MCMADARATVNLLNGIADTDAMCGDNEVKCCSGNKNSVCCSLE